MTTSEQYTTNPAGISAMTDEEREAYNARTAAAMEAAGERVEEKITFEDYFNFDEKFRWYFPDRRHYIEYKAMTEGDRRKYQAKTMTQMTMNRASGDSRIGINVARDREALLEISVTGWFMERRKESGEIVEVDFKSREFGWSRWSTMANPKYIEELEREIRKVNPWMQAEMSVEEIDKEIERLQLLRVEVLDRELGKENSSNK